MSALGPTGQPPPVSGLPHAARAAGSHRDGKRREQEEKKERKKDEVSIEGVEVTDSGLPDEAGDQRPHIDLRG